MWLIGERIVHPLRDVDASRDVYSLYDFLFCHMYSVYNFLTKVRFIIEFTKNIRRKSEVFLAMWGEFRQKAVTLHCIKYDNKEYDT